MTIGQTNFSFKPVDPNSYAQEYANKNGMTLEEAKAELKSKYGDPQKPEERNDVDIPIFNNYFNADNSSIASDSDILSLSGNLGDPDSYAQVYADEHGISLDEAKNELRELRGDPQAPNMNRGAANNENSISDLISRIFDFLRGGNGPQKEGDPEYHKELEEM